MVVLRWSEALLVLGWLLIWATGLWWSGVRDVAGFLIPIVAAAALPRIVRQLHPLSMRVGRSLGWRRHVGVGVVLVGGLLLLAGARAADATPTTMSRSVAEADVQAFLAAWEGDHGVPVAPSARAAQRAALDGFIETRARAQGASAGPGRRRLVGMFGGAALIALGLGLGTGRQDTGAVCGSLGEGVKQLRPG